MPRSRNINFFLMDGNASGKIRVTTSNWNGIAYKIPRNMLTDCQSLAEQNYSGIYFLFSSDSVYVGQAEVRANGGALYQRISEHERDRLQDSWDEVVIFTTRDNTLGRTDISFLENYFYTRAVQIGRFALLNNNTPSPGTVTPEKRSELEEYADFAELILGVLGYKVFEPAERPAATAAVTRRRAIPTSNHQVPPLPERTLKIGQYVYTAIENLGNSGYTFSEEEIDRMCTSEWARETFHTIRAFMKRYIEGQTDNKGSDGRPRFKSVPFTFGNTQVYISKEWFEHQRDMFDAWYNSL